MRLSTCHPERKYKAKGLCKQCYQAARHAANPAPRRAYSLEWKRRNPEKNTAYSLRWQRNNPEKRAAIWAKWARANPEKCAATRSRRRARLAGAAGSHTAAEWRDKIALHAGCCIYCGESKPLTRDHNVPLIRGGSDDISNILPSCGPCNSRKGTRTAREYLATTYRL